MPGRSPTRYGTIHRELVLRPDAALLLPALADAFDEPFADSSSLPTYLVSQLAARGRQGRALRARVATSSSAATTPTSPTCYAERFGRSRSLAQPAHRAAAELEPQGELRLPGEAVRYGRASPTARTPPRLEGNSLQRRASRADRSAQHDYDPADAYRARFAETEGHELLVRLQDVDFGGYLVDDLLVKTDRASMAWSLEARVPFLDTIVTNFAFSLPTRHKVRGLGKKRLLRKAMEPLLPARSSTAASAASRSLLRRGYEASLQPFARETLSPETLVRQGYLRPGPVARVLDDHVSGREDLSRQLWGLLAFTLWHERHVEGVTTRRRRWPVSSPDGVWIDMTASAHPLVFRPLVAAA